MESPYPRDVKEKAVGVLLPLVPTPSIDRQIFTAVAWTLWGIALVMVISRIVDTQKRRKKYGIEAFFSIGSFVLLSVALSLAIVSFKQGFDYVITFIAPGEEGERRRQHTHKYMLITAHAFTICYAVTLWVSKAAILFASRVLILNLPQYHAMFWSIVAIEAVCFVAYCVLQYVPHNMPYIWTIFDFPLLEESSFSLRNVYIAQFVLDALSDLLAMILPCRLLPGLKIALWKKLMALVVFTLGIIIIIFASLRMAVLLRSFHAQFPAVQASAQMLTWTQLQLAMSSIVANAPALRNLIQYQLNRFKELRRSAKGSAGGVDSRDGSARGSRRSVRVRRKRDSFEKLGIELLSVDQHETGLTTPLTPPLGGSASFAQRSSTTLLDGGGTGDERGVEQQPLELGLAASSSGAVREGRHEAWSGSLVSLQPAIREEPEPGSPRRGFCGGRELAV